MYQFLVLFIEKIKCKFLDFFLKQLNPIIFQPYFIKVTSFKTQIEIYQSLIAKILPLPLKITNTIIDVEHKLFSSPINKIDFYIRFLWCTRTTNLHQTWYTSMYCMSETCSLISYWFFFYNFKTLVSFRFVLVHVGLLKDISSFLCYLWMVLLQAMYKKDIRLEFHSNILFGLVGAHTWIAAVNIGPSVFLEKSDHLIPRLEIHIFCWIVYQVIE